MPALTKEKLQFIAGEFLLQALRVLMLDRGCPSAESFIFPQACVEISLYEDCVRRQHVSLMESEETSEGGLASPGTSSPSKESPEPLPSGRGQHATTESGLSASALIPQDPVSLLSAEEAAEMWDRSPNPVEEVPAELEPEEGDVRHWEELLERERNPTVLEMTPLEKEKWVQPLNSDQGKLVHPESSEYSSSPNPVVGVPSPTLDTHVKCPQDQDQAQAWASLDAVPQVQHEESSAAETVCDQREPATKRFLVCKTISEGCYKTEPLHDGIMREPLKQTEAVSGICNDPLPRAKDAIGEDPFPGTETVGRMTPKPCMDNGDKGQEFQGGEDPSSPHHPPHTFSGNSQGKTQLTGENIEGEMSLSPCEKGSNSSISDQGMEMVSKQSPSGPIEPCPQKEEEDHGRVGGSNTESPRQSISQARTAAENMEEVDESQHEEPEQGEMKEEPELKQAELQEQMLGEEEQPDMDSPEQELENEEDGGWNNVGQEPGGETVETEAPLQVLSPRTHLVSQPKVDLHSLGDSISLAEGIGPALPSEERVSQGQPLGEDILPKACAQAQPPEEVMSCDLSPMSRSPLTHSHTCHISEQLEGPGISGTSSCISISSQDCGETTQDDRTSNSKDCHCNGDRSDQGVADGGDMPFSGEPVSPRDAENLDTPRPMHLFSVAKKVESPGPTDLHLVAESPEIPRHQDLTPASPSDLSVVAAPTDLTQEDGEKRADQTKQEMTKQASCLLDMVPGEGASASASTVGAQTPQRLVTSDEALHEEPGTQPSFFTASRHPPSGQSPTKDGEYTEPTPSPADSVPQTLDGAPAPLTYQENLQQHQKSHSRSFVFQGKETGANVDHAVQHSPSLNQSHSSPDLEEAISRNLEAPNTVFQPSEETVVFSMDQQGQPPSPVHDTSLPLAPDPDVTPLPQPPSPVTDSTQSSALESDTSPPALILDTDPPLLPIPRSNPSLAYIPDCDHLPSTDPSASHPMQTVVSVPEDNNLGSASDSNRDDGVEKQPLMTKKEEMMKLHQDFRDARTQDVGDTSDLQASLLARNSDFPVCGNEVSEVCSDDSHAAVEMHDGKSPPDRVPTALPRAQRTPTDSLPRNLVQPLPALAFTNPIHFLQFSPRSPPTVRTLYQQKPVTEEQLWDQQLASATGKDTRSTPTPAAIMKIGEGMRPCRHRLVGQGELLPLPAQQVAEVTRHMPLEKSSSCPEKKVIKVEVPEQKALVKLRAKSKDWHRQGLKRVSGLTDSLHHEEEAHRVQPVISETVLLREKKPIDTREQFRHRHSKLINSSKLLYQEYSDVALNKAIQSQKRADSLAEDIELSSPNSPRLRRKVLSPQDSYLQRLSVSSNASLWQDIPMVRGSRMLMNMSREDQKLQEAKFELIMSEASYLRSLNVAVDHFQRSPELHAVLSNQERQWLFSRLQDVRDVSASFLFDLEEKFEEDMFTFHVCDVALRHAPEFRRVYLPYVTNQTYQEQTFQRLLNGNTGFQQVLERLESDPVCQRLSLKSFLILPFQRITRLKLLLQNILKRTRLGSEEEVQATQAYDALEKLIKDCNENVQRMKSTEELIYLSQKIEFECKIFPLISQSRRLVKCGELTALDFNSLSPKWKVTTRPIYLHLFNDCLLLSRPKEGGRFVVFDHAAFSDVRGEKCEVKLHGTNKNVFRLFLLQNNQGKRVEFLFRTETHSEKLRWISVLAPPRGEPDLLESPDAPQVQCLRAYKARENDELSLEKADIIMLMQNSNDGWMEGIRLSDGERGWFPSDYVEGISSKHVRQKNLKEEQRVKNAKQQVFCQK
ncbi:PREDICTED: rho guanine nucleotide exchange factor 5 isoform X1 [Crocodylus porosus]|uniref:Rho guanine nucleotide exchange factor 5 n=2 Tax=Crocodylus porosus TaxID=8502 RepID=A0A7M4FPY6_CROPO|nr:PREDICTED: rho guanine nucleotide exchange factor 5 isoform X1 [Crocodylus porosus]